MASAFKYHVADTSLGFFSIKVHVKFIVKWAHEK